MTTDSDIARLRAEFQEDLARVSSQSDLQALRDKYLGRKNGLVTALVKSVASAPPELKPVLGKASNELKNEIEQQLNERKAALEATKAPVGGVDISLPGRAPQIGHRHPLTIVREHIEAIFTRLGYQVLEGPEIEDDYHNFEALNMPAEHPARDMQDTLYLEGDVPGQGRPATLLRTHTSPMQIRYMESQEPPVRSSCPARCIRRDDLDLTHTPMFQQVEGLVLGGHHDGRSKGTLTASPRAIEPDTKCRYGRASSLTNRAPRCSSAGVLSRGGCPICKRTGWLEMAAAAWCPGGLRIGRLQPGPLYRVRVRHGHRAHAILKYGVDDIRLFYENDLRFLEQFPL